MAGSWFCNLPSGLVSPLIICISDSSREKSKIEKFSNCRSGEADFGMEIAPN